jgi:hypothetical protein
MEKVKPGDAVDLRVYRDGQTKPVKVTSVKAGDLPDEGSAFFFGDGATTLPRLPRPPQPPIAPAAPFRFRFNDDGEVRFQLDPRAGAELEDGLRELKGGLLELRRAAPRMRLRVDADEADAESPAAERPPVRSRSAPRIAIAGDAAVAAINNAGGPAGVGPAVRVWGGEASDGMIRVNGLKLTTIDGDLATYLGEGSARGLLVLGTSNEWDGVREGDVILRVDGRDVRDGDAVSVHVRGRDAHHVEVIRSGKRLSLRVPLDSSVR